MPAAKVAMSGKRSSGRASNAFATTASHFGDNPGPPATEAERPNRQFPGQHLVKNHPVENTSDRWSAIVVSRRCSGDMY
jgi:hypothetical protein